MIEICKLCGREKTVYELTVSATTTLASHFESYPICKECLQRPQLARIFKAFGDSIVAAYKSLP